MPPSREHVLKASALRRAMTLPEVLLWQHLKLRPNGFKFRRQHPVGPYILDFFCPAANLAIEIDGLSRNMGDRPDRDLRRDSWLGAQGIRILRLPAAELLGDIDCALHQILGTIDASHRQPPAH